MTNKQKKKWEEVYANTLAITSLQPWEKIPESVPLIYHKKDCDEPVVFSIWGYSSDICGVACYFSFHDYLCAMKRLKSKNLKNEPIFLLQNMILGIWGDREEVSKENKALIKELGLKFRGKGGWLFFETYAERCEPRFLNYEETVLLADALGNLCLMLEAVFKKGLKVDFENGETVQRSSGDDDVWYNAAVGYKNMQELLPVTVISQSEQLDALAAMPAGSRIVELDERCMPVPARDDKTGVAYCPLLISAADSKSGEPLVLRYVSYDEDREDALYDVIEEVAEKFGKPKQIKINDEFTRWSIGDFCEKAGIKLNCQQKPLKQIDKIMAEAFGDGRLFDVLTEEEPEQEKNSKVINIDSRNTQTLVIAVSLGKGCYRHIKISGGATLEELHSVILDAFCFEDDHAHVFFLNNKAWSDGGYYSRYIEDEERFSCDVTLSQALEEKQKFLYIFDFGDEWRFQCRVLSIKGEACSEAEIVRSVGEAPEQYPDYEDEDYE